MSSPEQEPSFDRFYGLHEVPDDVSDQEGELIQHTKAVIQKRIGQRCPAPVADIWAQSKHEEKKVKEDKRKRRKKRGHGWSQKGTKSARRAKSQYKTPEQQDTYFFTRARVGPAYASRCREYSLSGPVGGTVAQFLEWIRSDPKKSSTLGESSCSCPCCPYSTGSHLLQRQLLLRRLYQLHNFS